MLYAILIHGSEESFERQRPEETEATLATHFELQHELKEQGRLGPVMRLVPHVGATVRRRYSGDLLVTDGPLVDSSEQLMGIYIVECEAPDDAVEVARRLAVGMAVFEIRPISWFDPGMIGPLVPGR